MIARTMLNSGVVACLLAAGTGAALADGVFSGYGSSTVSRQVALDQARENANTQAVASNFVYRTQAPDRVQEDCNQRDKEWFCTVMTVYNH